MKRYQEVYDYLLNFINKGMPNDKLMTEKEICDKFSVSRITAGKAYDMLYSDGFIYRIPQKGTFIATKTTKKKLAVILPQEESNNYKIMDSIIMSNSRFGYKIDVFYSGFNIDNENNLLSNAYNENYAGIIFLPFGNLDNQEILSKIYIKKIPLILLDFEILGFDFPIISSNNEQGEYEIVSSFVNKGYKSFSFINLGQFNLDTINARYRGYCKALLENDIPLTNFFSLNFESKLFKSFEENVKVDITNMNKIVNVFIDMKIKPEVLCFVNDASANEFIIRIKKINSKLLDGVIITGFDNLQNIGMNNFSTVQQNFGAMGKAALITLDKIVRGENVEKKKYIKTKLILR